MSDGDDDQPPRGEKRRERSKSRARAYPHSQVPHVPQTQPTATPEHDDVTDEVSTASTQEVWTVLWMSMKATLLCEEEREERRSTRDPTRESKLRQTTSCSLSHVAVTLKQRCCCSESQLETMVSHARSAAQRREQRRRAEARFAGRLCKLVEQRHRGFVPARALVRAAARCPQDASTQTQLEDLVDAEKEQLVGPTPRKRATSCSRVCTQATVCP